jgi:DNA-binding MarR family transcriptional regulator
LNRSVEPAIVTACRALYAAIDRLDHEAAEAIGVSRSELRCLNLLEHGPCRPRDIAKALDLTTGSVTTMLDRLEQKGLIQRSQRQSDRRSILISATPEVFRQVGPVYRAVAQSLVATVGTYPDEEQTMAIRHLNDVTHACLAALHGR